MFFTVMWRGLCQAVRWLSGLFGYRRAGRLAKCVWGVFSVSMALCAAILAGVLLWAAGNKVYYTYRRHFGLCSVRYCRYQTMVSRDICFHNHHDGKGYVYNVRTGEKTVKNVIWIAEPLKGDSLICFSTGKKRGYFNRNTGRVVVEPRYDHAWVFSDGLAAVEENGSIHFIDGTGKVVIDNAMEYVPDHEGYVFHEGYCVVDARDGIHRGLMDRTGRMMLAAEYDCISPSGDWKYWCVRKGDSTAVLDDGMKEVLPMMAGSGVIDGKTVRVVMPDHTLRRYDMEGRLIDDFYIWNVFTLEYDKDEMAYKVKEVENENTGLTDEVTEACHLRATARLRVYVAGDGYKGLMTADGHRVTMPLYKDIQAIGYDVYMCSMEDDTKVIVNGKGEIVR